MNVIRNCFFLLTIHFLIVLQNETRAQANPGVQIEGNIIDSVFSKSLDENRQIWVSLPENFDATNGARYPVVYILDGDVMLNTLQTVYNNYWGHYMPHMILVGISNRENRTRDLTTSVVESRRGRSFKQETGGAENFIEFIEKELIPYIDKKYPTTSYRTLIGHSYGGLFVVNALIHHNHIFQNYIAIDPSLDWDNQKLLNAAKSKLQTENFKGKSLYISMAAEQLHMYDEEITVENVMLDTSEFTLFPRSIIEFSQEVEENAQNGLNFAWKSYPEDLHGTVPLPSIRDGLIFLFKWFQFKHPARYNNPETPVAELVELLAKQGEILTENFGVPTPPMIEELFIGYGFMYLQTEQFEKAKLFFEMLIKYYPGSAMGYSVMADYFESQNDNVNALKYATKAFEISGTDQDKARMEEIRGRE